MSDDKVQMLLGEVVANQRNMVKEQQRMNAVFEKHFDEDKTQFNALGKRLRLVEQKVNYAAGAVAVVSGIFVIFWQTIVTSFRA